MRPQYCVPSQSIEHLYVAWMALIKCSASAFGKYWMPKLSTQSVNVFFWEVLFPESGSLGHGLVDESFEFSDELVKRDDASAYFHVSEIAVIKDDVVLVEYFLGDKCFVDAHVLEVLHGSSQIEVLDVNAHVSCVVFFA